MKRGLLVLLGFLALGVLGLGQHVYVFYYSRSSGQDAEVNLLNISTKPSNYKLQIYDAWGKLLWEKEGDLAPKDATFQTLSKNIPEDAGNWGIALVTSSEPMVIGVEYFLNQESVTVDLITWEFPTQGESVYWAGIYHTEVAGTSTGLILMNPSGQEVTGQLVIYKSDGSVASQGSFTLSPFEAKFYNLLQIVESSTRMWGLLEVFSQGSPIAIACKYFRDNLMRVKNVPGQFLQQVTEQPNQPQPVTPGPQKED